MKLLFWIDYNTNKLIQSNLDGSRCITLQLDQQRCLSNIRINVYVCMITAFDGYKDIVCTIIKNNNINTGGLAVDWINDKLYYHDRCHYHIGVLDLATNLYKTIANDTVTYHYRYINIIVDPTTRFD